MGRKVLVQQGLESHFSLGWPAKTNVSRPPRRHVFSMNCLRLRSVSLSVIPIVTFQLYRLLAAVHHFQEGPHTLFRYAREVLVFVRSQIVIQCQFQGIGVTRDEEYRTSPLNICHGGA